MATEEVLDLEALLAPVSEAAPAGEPLRRPDGTVDPAYDRVKSAAQEARTRERALANWHPSGDDQGDERPPAPDWRTVQQEARQILTKKSKDLWVTAWLIEALTRNHGFPGLRDGLRLAHELIERYWDQIHPMPSEDDDESAAEFRVTQIAGLNGVDAEGVLIAPLRNVPLFTSDEWGPIALVHDSVASSLASMSSSEDRQKRISSTGALTMDQIEGVAANTPPSILQARLEEVEQSLSACEELGNALETHCVDEDGDSHAPSLGNIRGVLNECRDCLQRFLRGSGGGGEAQSGEEQGEEMSAEMVGRSLQLPAASGGRVQTREDAFRALLQVADFFRRTEPHSPVSYALEQAVRWGRMSLPELWRELIEDNSTRSDLFRRTGIPEPTDDDS